MPAPDLSHFGFGVNSTLRTPSRLREVHNLESETPPEDTPAVRTTAVVNVGTDATYNIGDEVSSYADAFYNGRSGELFGEAGLLARYYSICREKGAQAATLGKEEDIKHWATECRTWDLLQRLYLERTKESGPLRVIHPYLSNRALEQHFYQTNVEAAESKIVLDWCQDGGTHPDQLETRGNRWFYTKESIKTRRRLGKAAKNDSVVTSLDPDAPLRQGKRLDEQDVEFERNLLKTMYMLIRAGGFTEAAEVARASGNEWRAASLYGCVEHSDPEIDGTDGIPEGSTNKPLWRRMCYALARQSGIDPYEKAMYGALCGDLASVLPVCQTWEDRLWVNFNAMNQSKVESMLRAQNRVDSSHDFPIPNYDYLTPHVVLDGLLRHDDENIRREAKSPLRMIQARIITNQIDALLIDIHQQLLAVQNGAEPNVACSPHVIRFVSHLILALRDMGISFPEEPVNAILQAYVELLTSANQGNAVALYASQLPPDLAVEALARYLTSIEDETRRKEQLMLTEECGIDVRSAILRTVELVFEEVLSDLPMGESLGNITDKVGDQEERSIKALEWLKLDESLANETILLGNNLYRRLLLSGRLSAANSLSLRMSDVFLIPQDLGMDDDVSRVDPQDEARMRDAIEYVGYCTLMRALSKYEEWKMLVRGRPQEINGRRDPVGLRQWKSDVARVKTESIIMLKEVLEGNWCDPVELCVAEEEPVFEEMKNLRNMYIPEVVLRLHGIYSAHEGRDVEAAMNLAVLVSERLTDPMQKSGSLKTYVTELGLLGAYLV